MSRFDQCLPLILAHEGGYSDHKLDPGGATNLGVTLATLSAHRGRTVTKAEVKALTVAEAGAIYLKSYWHPIHADELPAGLDYMLFDLAVNSGVGRARKYLQRAAGVNEDGIIGPATLAAVKARNGLQMVNAVAGYREAFYRGLPTFPTFGRGWMRRLNEVTAKAREMAA
jgi:lysozyme family protein